MAPEFDFPTLEIPGRGPSCLYTRVHTDEKSLLPQNIRQKYMEVASLYLIAADKIASLEGKLRHEHDSKEIHHAIATSASYSVGNSYVSFTNEPTLETNGIGIHILLTNGWGIWKKLLEQSEEQTNYLLDKLNAIFRISSGVFASNIEQIDSSLIENYAVYKYGRWNPSRIPLVLDIYDFGGSGELRPFELLKRSGILDNTTYENVEIRERDDTTSARVKLDLLYDIPDNLNILE